MENISVYDINSVKMDIKINHRPNECPVCHSKIRPEIRYGSVTVYSTGPQLEIAYQCPSNNCQKLFIAYYSVMMESAKLGYSFEHCLLMNLLNVDFDIAIKDTSPDFVNIYNQAYCAEQRGLDQICGMGYRKALEFLIKDYLIKSKPDQADSIRSTVNISTCIANFIDSKNIKECAKRAIWLGNDETHYERKWDNKDISDLKAIIDLTVYWIASEIKTQNLLEDMDKPK